MHRSNAATPLTSVTAPCTHLCLRRLVGLVGGRDGHHPLAVAAAPLPGSLLDARDRDARIPRPRAALRSLRPRRARARGLGTGALARPQLLAQVQAHVVEIELGSQAQVACA